MNRAINEKLESIKAAFSEAAQDVPPEFVSKIKRLVKHNQHIEAYVVGAQFLGASAIAKKFKLIGELQRMEGDLPPFLNKYRYTVYQQMMKYAKQQLDRTGYEQFHSAF